MKYESIVEGLVSYIMEGACSNFSSFSETRNPPHKISHTKAWWSFFWEVAQQTCIFFIHDETKDIDIFRPRLWNREMVIKWLHSCILFFWWLVVLFMTLYHYLIYINFTFFYYRVGYGQEPRQVCIYPLKRFLLTERWPFSDWWVNVFHHGTFLPSLWDFFRDVLRKTCPVLIKMHIKYNGQEISNTIYLGVPWFPDD